MIYNNSERVAQHIIQAMLTKISSEKIQSCPTVFFYEPNRPKQNKSERLMKQNNSKW